MTKLNGTTGQLFAGLTESLNTRTASRFDKGGGGKSVGNSFRDLLHTVSNPATRVPGDQANEGSIKAGMLRTSLAQSDESDERKDNAVHERSESADEPKPSSKRSPLDPAPKAEVQSRLSFPTTATAGQELAAVQAMRPQAQPLAADKNDAAARSKQSMSGRDLPAPSAAQAMTAGPAGPVARPVAAAPRAATTQQGAPLPKSAPDTPGFEAVTANIDAVTANIQQAAKLSSREALPQPIKVTVVQQETHLPPVAQFTAAQQVANAVVAELKGASTSSAAPTSSAAANAGPSQGNAPDQALKVLTISLDPPALGNVTVRLRLVGEAVSVHLAADRKDTSQMLDQQRDSIRELMQSAGYVADVAPVRHGTLDGFQLGGGQSHASLSGQQQAPNGQGAPDNSSASSGQPERGAKQARDDHQPNQEARHEQNVAPRAGRGPVYL